LTRKQRQKLKREQEAAHKRFMRRGYIGPSNSGDRPVRSTESPRERHQREQREREAERIAVRRAEHVLPEGKVWAMVEACIGRTGELCEKLRKAEIPHFRPRDEIEQVLRSGRVRKMQVPLFDRTVFVGLDSRDQLEELAAAHPWLMERRVYGPIPGMRHDREWTWDVEQVERHETGRDRAGNPVIAPVTIPDAEMRGFADVLIGSRPLFEVDDPIHVGEQVRVADGPFASFPGVVDAFDVSTGKVQVSVSIFGRATPVELELRQIERQ
jgi:transcriptional antiterminator NusG